MSPTFFEQQRRSLPMVERRKGSKVTVFGSLPAHARKSQTSTRPVIRTDFEFGLYMWREVFHTIEQYEKKKEVSIVLVRKCAQRILDMFNLPVVVAWDQIGNPAKGMKITWEDFSAALDEDVIPHRFTMSARQVVFMLLTNNGSSILATCYFIVVLSCIIGNVVLMILGSMPNFSELEEVFQVYEDFIVSFFTIEYLIKVICVMDCPIAFFDEYWLLSQARPNKGEQNVHNNAFERLTCFMMQTPNVIDLISISPNLLSPIINVPSYLSCFRILRVFRILGSFFVELQVTSNVMGNAMNSILVLFVYVVLFAAVAAVVLQQVEPEGSVLVGTVPKAMMYVVARFVSMQHSLPGVQGRPELFVGGCVMVLVGLFKGILFLLPIDRIKKASIAAYKSQDEESSMSKDVETIAASKKSSGWMMQPACPVARVRVIDQETLDSGVAIVPLPIYRDVDTKEVLSFAIINKPRGIFRTSPELEVRLDWVPHPMMKNLPYGSLELTMVQVKQCAAGQRFRCELEVPTALHGSRAAEKWTSDVSLASETDTACWAETSGRGSEGCSHTFAVLWEQSAEKPDKDKMRLKQVSELLEKRSVRLYAIMEELNAMI